MLFEYFENLKISISLQLNSFLLLSFHFSREEKYFFSLLHHYFPYHLMKKIERFTSIH